MPLSLSLSSRHLPFANGRRQHAIVVPLPVHRKGIPRLESLPALIAIELPRVGFRVLHHQVPFEAILLAERVRTVRTHERFLVGVPPHVER